MVVAFQATENVPPSSSAPAPLPDVSRLALWYAGRLRRQAHSLQQLNEPRVFAHDVKHRIPH